MTTESQARQRLRGSIHPSDVTKLSPGHHQLGREMSPKHHQNYPPDVTKLSPRHHRPGRESIPRTSPLDACPAWDSENGTRQGVGEAAYPPCGGISPLKLAEHGPEVSLSYHRSHAGFTGKSFSGQGVVRVGPPSFLISVNTAFRISLIRGRICRFLYFRIPVDRTRRAGRCGHRSRPRANRRTGRHRS